MQTEIERQCLVICRYFWEWSGTSLMLLVLTVSYFREELSFHIWQMLMVCDELAINTASWHSTKGKWTQKLAAETLRSEDITVYYFWVSGNLVLAQICISVFEGHCDTEGCCLPPSPIGSLCKAVTHCVKLFATAMFTEVLLTKTLSQLCTTNILLLCVQYNI